MTSTMASGLVNAGETKTTSRYLVRAETDHRERIDRGNAVGTVK